MTARTVADIDRDLQATRERLDQLLDERLAATDTNPKQKQELKP